MEIQKVDLNSFEQIYNDTYTDVLKFVTCKCSNLEDINDIIQDTYVGFYKCLKRKREIELNNVNAFIFGIAKNKIKDYYGLKYKLQNMFVSKDTDETEYKDSVTDLNVEDFVLDSINTIEAWKHIKKKKPIVGRIFYLYYSLDMTIREIAQTLGVTEVITKNYLYRTIRELNTILKKESD